VDPALVLDGPAPRLIDEWQVEPELWNHVRRTVDRRNAPGQFILRIGSLAVIIGSGYGYVRPDGVAVVPIGALKAVIHHALFR
jgi:hypothetical protein